jgi:two-component system sensor histidine kinase HydH
MTTHEWLTFVTCVGLVSLAVVVLRRGNRNAMESPLLLLCIDDFGWNFAEMSYQMTRRPVWHWLDVTLSPFAVPLALHVVIAYVGRLRTLGWVLVSAYLCSGALSFASALAFFSPAMSDWTFSPQWSVFCLAGYIPILLLGFVLLLLHLRATRDPRERSATVTMLASVITGGALTSTELFDDFDIPLPALSNVGTLVSTGLLTIAIVRLGMVERRRPVGMVAGATVLGALGVGGYVILLRSLSSTLAVIVLGACTAGLFVCASVREKLASQHSARHREERFAALGRIADQMAHDIRNPLAALKGAIELVREDERREKGHTSKYHDLMLEQVERLDRVVENYRQIGRISPMRSVVQINEIVTDLAALQAAGQPNVAVVNELATDLPMCRVDRDLLSRALENLVKNAVEAMKERGTLIFRTEQCSAWFGPPWIRITVRDTGAGIDSRELNRLFSGFYTTKPTGGGLGLTFVQRVVQAHGGRVTLTSRPGEGTAVQVELPVAR